MQRASILVALVGLLATAGCARVRRHYELRDWLHVMVVEHDFTDAEVAEALGIEVAEVSDILEREEVSRDDPPADTGERLKVLPYPGGRHPRIGFLDGAIDPHRDTKASVFLPWDNAGYVVIDLPEAIWWQPGDLPDGQPELLYLAHTHIPTTWDRRGIELEPVDWTVGEDGELRSARVFPGGVTFATSIRPGREVVRMKMTVCNGSEEAVTGLRTQICALLKGAPAFNAQTNDNKKILDDAVAVKSAERDRWIVKIWQRGRAWANPPCPCMHSDPTFPDLAPGECATLHGVLFFHEGADVEAAIEAARPIGGE